MTYSLLQLAKIVGGEIIGDGACVITHVSPIQNADSGSISFVGTAKYQKYLSGTQASAVIVTRELAAGLSVPALVVKNPRAAHARVTALLHPAFIPEPGIHASAIIAQSAVIAKTATIAANVVIEEHAVVGENAWIEPGCVIGRQVTIGAGVHLYANVTIYYGCSIGDNTIIHSSSVIGADGFGFEFDQGAWVKIPQIGAVRIGNNVEIGACSTVDRGALYDTVIGDGVKLDNHVQIAHNVQVGAHTIMSNGVGVAGSTKIGKNCIIGGMAGIRDNIEITDNVMITAMALVSKSLAKPGSYSSNTPIDDTQTWRKNSARFRQLDEMARRISQLEKKLKE
ncbi:MAG: UDP-3-O-(3-hydroxymyristoyl)glucosamine N-acyltransferase [Gammaproteobacteria bacterium]|nr:UDP-3-O-(3-hydroxymyristoyl)glucosamine N-acyltransferase [Gammaproteobacteria bacterium]